MRLLVEFMLCATLSVFRKKKNIKVVSLVYFHVQPLFSVIKSSAYNLSHKVSFWGQNQNIEMSTRSTLVSFLVFIKPSRTT